jgi:glycosyltransferase involved in cell wall biosynthesis
MKKNILFIADSNLRNPILQSQGLPFLYSLDHSKYKPFVLSFEGINISKEESLEFQSIIKKYDSKISFLPVTLSKKGIMPSLFYFIWKGSKILYSIVRKFDIKLLHARSFKPAFLSVIIKIIFKPSIKVIYDNRGLYIDESIFRNGLSKGSYKEKILRTIERIVINKCDQIVVVSNAFKSHLAEQFSSRIKNIINKTTIIPNRTEIKFNNSDISLKLKRMKDKTICAYAGSSASWQGIDDFYNVFSIILNIIPTTHFKILTYEPEVFLNHPPENINLAERLIVEKVEPCNVKAELINATFGLILRKPDVVSRVSAPIKFAEYLSAGLPVILREGIGDTEQIIKKYKVGVIIKKNEYESAISELQELLNDKDVYHRCLKIADKEFNINTSFKQYEEIYDNLLSSC